MIKLKSLLLLVICFQIQHLSAQVYMNTDGKKSVLRGEGWKISNLSKGQYEIYYDSVKNIQHIDIECSGCENDLEVRSIINSCPVNVERGLISLKCDVSISGDSAIEKSGYYVQGVDQNGRPVVFNNMKDVTIAKKDTLKTLSIEIPFDVPISKIYWGVFLIGRGTIKVHNFRLEINKGEFTNAWLEKYKRRADTDSQFVHSLADLGKIWGYLKYRTSADSKNNINWDDILVSSVNSLFEKRSLKEYNDTFKELLNYSNESRSLSRETANANLSWIKSGKFNSKVRKKLEHLIREEASYPRKFVKESSTGTPNPEFINEISYSQFPLPSASYRLLALFRYWTAIKYFYPYLPEAKNNWDDILVAMIPKFISANTTDQYKRSILLLNASIADSHSSLIESIPITDYPRLIGMDLNEADKVPVLLPFRILKRDTVFYAADVDSLFSGLSGVKKGDQIVSVNGITPSSWYRKYTNYLSASTVGYKDYLLSSYNIMSYALLGKDGNLNIEFKNSNGIKTYSDSYNMQQYVNYLKNLFLPSVTQADSSPFKVVSDSILYINPSAVDSTIATEITKMFKNVKTLLFDFRKYPDYMGLKKLIPHLINNKSNVTLGFQWSDIQNPGYLSPMSIDTIAPTNPVFSGKVILLVDESTLSMSEFYANLIKEASKDAIIVGRPTAGAIGDVSTITLPGNYKLAFTGMIVSFNNRKNLKTSLKPDRLIPADLEIGRGYEDWLLNLIKSIK